MTHPLITADQFGQLNGAEQLRAFDEVVQTYADARRKSSDIGAEIARSAQPPADDMRQRLADAGQELFIAGETLKAYAMTLRANDLLARSAALLDAAADEAGAI